MGMSILPIAASVASRRSTHVEWRQRWQWVAWNYSFTLSAVTLPSDALHRHESLAVEAALRRRTWCFGFLIIHYLQSPPKGSPSRR